MAFAPLSQREEAVAKEIVQAAFNMPTIKNGIRRIIL